MLKLTYVLAALVVATSLQAHEVEQGVGVLCDTQAQIERFASLDANTDAIKVINADAKQNVCAMVEVQYIRGQQVGTARTTKGAVQLVEILLTAVKMHGQWGSVTPEIQYTMFQIAELEAALPLTLVTYKPDYATSPPEVREWFKNAKLTPAAYKRLGWHGCCDNADRFVTTFAQEDENWYYYQDGKKILIPADTIHTEDDPTMPQQLKVEGVLFIISGTVGCFWAPKTGG